MDTSDGNFSLCRSRFDALRNVFGWLNTSPNVQTSGNDVFYRNPRNVSENLFVSLSSPSSQRYEGVEDLGRPEQAARRTLQQYLDELGTTRLGVRRSGEVVSANRRTGADGRTYYDVQVCKAYSLRKRTAN